VKLQEAENQIVIDYEVYAQRPHDAELLIPAIEIHATKLGRMPHLVAADAGFHSRYNQAAAKAKVKRKVSSASASQTTAARVQAASVSRRSDGSATDSDGVPDARGASASASVGMASSVAAIAATTA
jgi:hypothetical protein